MSETGRSEFEKRYMLGYCDAMAMALSSYADLPIRAMHPVHVRSDGSERTDPDFVHVYVMDGVLAWDAKGRRTEAKVEEDFSEFIAMLKRPDDIEIRISTADYIDMDDFLDSSECDTSHVAQALSDAVEHLGLDPQIVEMTIRQLKKTSGFRP